MGQEEAKNVSGKVQQFTVEVEPGDTIPRKFVPKRRGSSAMIRGFRSVYGSGADVVAQRQDELGGYFREFFPDKLNENDGDVILTIKKLLKIVHQLKPTESDLHTPGGLLNRPTDGTIISKERNPGLIKRTQRVKVGMDDQSEP